MEVLPRQHRFNIMMLPIMSYQTTIQALLKRNGGFITSADLKHANIPSYAFEYALKNRQLKKEAKGFYSDKTWIKDDYFLFQHRYPKYIFSYQSALFLFGLTDRTPEHLEVSGPKNYRPLGKHKSDVLRHVVRQDELYPLGIREIRTVYGNLVRAYSPERTLADLIKHREEADPEIFVKALRSFQRRKDKDIPLLLDYAEKMGIRKKAYEILELIA
jgi:hypothetical protein